MFGFPGPMELLIIGVLLLAPLAAVAVVLFVVLRKTGPSSAPRPCPKCGGWTVAAARFCHHCGGPLQGPPPGQNQA